MSAPAAAVFAKVRRRLLPLLTLCDVADHRRIGFRKARTDSFGVAFAALAMFPLGAMLLMLPLRRQLYAQIAR